MGDVDVADLEARPLPVQAARPERREPTLVGELRQRVGLVDDLRQLAPAEEVFDRRADALGVDQAPGGDVLGVLQAHPLLDGPAELEEPLAELVGGELVDGPEAAVAQVVDVVDVPLALAEVEDVPDRVDVVERVERHLVVGTVLVELPVDPEPADLAEAVAVGVEELLVEELAGLLQLRRVARPEPLIDPEQGALVVGGRVFLERLEDQIGSLASLRTSIGADLGVGQDLGLGLGDRRGALDQDLAGVRVDDVAAGDPAFEERGEPSGASPVSMSRRRRRRGGSRRRRRTWGLMARSRVIAENLPDWSIRTPEGVLLRDLELDPAPALGDDPAGVELLVAGLDVDDEVDAGAPVELADDDALGAVDDELAAADHDRHVAEVDRLLDRRLALVEAEPDVERAAVGQAELAALVGLVAGLAQVELDVFQLEGLVIALDREDLAEDPLQTGVGASSAGRSAWRNRS